MKSIPLLLAGLLLSGSPAAAAVIYTATPPELSFYSGGIGSWSPFPLDTRPSWECDFNADGTPEVLITAIASDGSPAGGVFSRPHPGVEILAAPKLGLANEDGLSVPLLGGDFIDANVASLYQPDLQVQWGDENFRIGEFSMLTAAFNIGQEGTFYIQPRYLGVRFLLDDGWHYGWIYAAGGSTSLVVYGYAWETEPDLGIVAGAVPEPATCALLALTAACALSRRQRDRTPSPNPFSLP